MARRDVPKVLQNSLYDNFVQSYGFGIPISNVTEDVMLKGWEIYSELPKGLGVQASIYTREPYYKFERKANDPEVLYRYCARDSSVTIEICEQQDSILTGSGLQHYHINVQMLNPLLYMELRGIKYDQNKVNTKLKETNEEITQVGEALNQIAGTELRGAKGSLSSKRLATALYTKLGYPPQYKKEFGRRSDKLTTDIEALLTLRKRQPTIGFSTESSSIDTLKELLRHSILSATLTDVSGAVTMWWEQKRDALLVTHPRPEPEPTSKQSPKNSARTI
jgi:DNA polymerase I-like protein with 3'-5' exonuclease and polymerase domains